MQSGTQCEVQLGLGGLGQRSRKMQFVKLGGGSHTLLGSANSLESREEQNRTGT